MYTRQYLEHLRDNREGVMPRITLAAPLHILLAMETIKEVRLSSIVHHEPPALNDESEALLMGSCTIENNNPFEALLLMLDKYPEEYNELAIKQEMVY